MAAFYVTDSHLMLNHLSLVYTSWEAKRLESDACTGHCLCSPIHAALRHYSNDGIAAGDWSVRKEQRRPTPGRHLQGASHNNKAEGYVRDLANKRHPGFHKTDTIDYAIVLSGEIYALMDEGEALLKAGDVLIQRGTNHAWSNRTEQPCCIAFVLIDAEPV